MKKKSGKTLMQKWKNKIGGKLSALDKKKLVLTNIPYALAAFYADRAFFLYRNSPGEDMGNKLLYAMEHADRIFAGFVLSNNWKDLLAGIVVAVVLKVLVWQKQADAKKLRKGVEYGSARWGTAEDIKPFMADDFWMNIPLTATESITMESRPKNPKYARNKNICVIGGSGSGKTRFFVKVSIMMMNCSMVITDPKGTLIEECGKMLDKGPPKRDKHGNVVKDKSGKVVHEPYVIKVLNSINFSKSLHYNPFAYLKSEKDILKLVTVIIANTKGEGEKATEDFWVKAEKLLYTALIALIWYEGDEDEKNMNTLIDLLNESETREDDENYKNPVDMLFEDLEKRNPEHFAVRQYKKYKLASGKTAKSILISCGARLAPFDIPQLREIMSYDELELDKLGDEKSALFFLISDTDTTYNFLVALAFSQMFNLLCERADNTYGGRLPYHVRVLWDEAANTGQVPGLEKIVAVIRSREISLTLFYQAMSQCKALYKDHSETIMGNMDSIVFLGGREASTLKDISENWLGKATISMQTEGRSRGQSESYSQNMQRLGRELMTTSEITTMPGDKCILQLRGLPPFLSPKYDLKKHPNYKYTAEFDKKKNAFRLESLFRHRPLRLKPEDEYTVYEVDGSDTDEEADLLNFDDLDSDEFV